MWTKENRQQKSLGAASWERWTATASSSKSRQQENRMRLTPNQTSGFFFYACCSGFAAANEQSLSLRKPTEPSSPQSETRLRE